MKFIRLSASGASGFYPRRDSSPSISSRSSSLSFVSFADAIALLFSSLAKLY